MKQVTNRAELFELHDQLCKECRDIMVGKNHDYAGGKDDPFSNFLMSKALGIEPEMGLLLRCLDKFKRIEAFVNTGNLKVKEEGVFDAVRDVMNYMVLLGGLLTVRMAQQDGAVSCAGADGQGCVEVHDRDGNIVRRDRIEYPPAGSIYDQHVHPYHIDHHNAMHPGHVEAVEIKQEDIREYHRKNGYDQTLQDPRVGKLMTYLQRDVRLPTYDPSDYKEGPKD